MSRITINQIIARYQAGFGYIAQNMMYLTMNKAWEQFIDIPVYQVGDASFANVTFTNQKSGNAYSFGLPFGATSKFIAPPLMVSFSRDKNVVRTPIDRSEVEVIEYFGLKPVEMKIQGILIDNEEHVFPTDLNRRIAQMFAEPGTFKVAGDLFSDEGVTELFFDSGYEKSFVEGYDDTIKFSVNAIQTQPVEVRINQTPQ